MGSVSRPFGRWQSDATVTFCSLPSLNDRSIVTHRITTAFPVGVLLYGTVGTSSLICSQYLATCIHVTRCTVGTHPVQSSTRVDLSPRSYWDHQPNRTRRDRCGETSRSAALSTHAEPRAKESTAGGGPPPRPAGWRICPARALEDGPNGRYVGVRCAHARAHATFGRPMHADRAGSRDAYRRVWRVPMRHPTRRSP